VIFSACAGLFHSCPSIGRSVSPTEPVGKVWRELSQDGNIQRGMTAGNIIQGLFDKHLDRPPLVRACANRSAEKKPSRDSPDSHRFNSVLPGNAVSIKTG